MTKFTHEDMALKDALMRVTPPDIEQSWSRMEELLDTAANEPVAALPAAGLLLKQKIWLSSIALLIFSSILVGSVISQNRENSISNRSGQIANHDLSGPVAAETTSTITSSQTTTDIESGQNNTAPVAEANHAPINQNPIPTPDPANVELAAWRLGENNVTTASEPSNDELAAWRLGGNPNQTDDEPAALQRSGNPNQTDDELAALQPSGNHETLTAGTVPHILMDIKTPTEILWLTDDSMPENPGLEGLPSSLKMAGILPMHSTRVGLRLAVNTGPDFNYSKIPAQFQGGFYVNIGRSPVHTFQGEVLYNQLPIRPIRTVYVHNLPAGHSLTDSITVKKLNFVSIPLMVKYQLVNNLSISFGPQISFLTGLTGDKKTTSTIAGEETKTSTYQHLDSKYGMNPINLGMVVDIGYSFERISFNARCQYGFTNIEIDNNSPVRVYRNHSNFTFGVAYNLR